MSTAQTKCQCSIGDGMIGPVIEFCKWHRSVNRLERQVKKLQADLDALREERDALDKLNRDECERDTAIRDLVRPILGEAETDGDSYGVPTPVTIVESLCKRFDALRAENARLLAERDRQYDETVNQIAKVGALENRLDQMEAALATLGATLNEEGELVLNMKKYHAAHGAPREPEVYFEGWWCGLFDDSGTPCCFFTSKHGSYSSRMKRVKLVAGQEGEDGDWR